MSRVFKIDELPRASNVVSIGRNTLEIGDPIPVDDLGALPLSDRIREIINPSFEGDDASVDSESRMSAIVGMVARGVEAEKILGILLDDRYAIHRRSKGTTVTEDFGRREIARAHARVTKGRDDFNEPVDPVWLRPTSDESAKVDRLKALKYSDLLKLREPKWLIKGLLPENGLFEIFGQFKSGKTFFGMEMGLCIATGLDFFDVPTIQGKVIYVLAEGSKKAFANRITQWIDERAGNDATLKKRLQQAVERNFWTVGAAVHLDIETTVKAFIAANPGKWTAIFIDTLMRNMVGDPLKPQDMMKFVRGCDAIRNATGSLVTFLHHMKRDGGTGGFGSIVGEASVDGAAIVMRKGDKRILKIKLMRDADDNVPAWIGHLVPRRILEDFTDSGDKEIKTAVLVFDQREQDDLTDKLLAYILELRPKTVKALKVGFVVCSERTVERHLSKLRQLGYVSEDGLELTLSGRQQATSLFELEDTE